MFRLSKWYLDLVTDRGSVLILYAARVEWARMGITYSSVLHVTHDGVACDRATFRRVTQPRLEGDVLAWTCEPLAVTGEWRRDADPIDCTLTDGPAGLIRWSCHMPRAHAAVRLGAKEMHGLGYAERLCVTVFPTRLPFQRLKWGRHLSPQHALVWIDWDDERNWTWLDGTRQRDSVDLRLWDTREVRDRRIAGLHEHKHVSRSAIIRHGAADDEGWTIHEVVTR